MHDGQPKLFHVSLALSAELHSYSTHDVNGCADVRSGRHQWFATVIEAVVPREMRMEVDRGKRLLGTRVTGSFSMLFGSNPSDREGIPALAFPSPVPPCDNSIRRRCRLGTLPSGQKKRPHFGV